MTFVTAADVVSPKAGMRQGLLLWCSRIFDRTVLRCVGAKWKSRRICLGKWLFCRYQTQRSMVWPKVRRNRTRKHASQRQPSHQRAMRRILRPSESGGAAPQRWQVSRGISRGGRHGRSGVMATYFLLRTVFTLTESCVTTVRQGVGRQGAGGPAGARTDLDGLSPGADPGRAGTEKAGGNQPRGTTAHLADGRYILSPLILPRISPPGWLAV